jgi:hypothetical protein
VKQNSRPSYGWKAELAATLSLRSTQLGGTTLLKTDIPGQFMLVGSANLWPLSHFDGNFVIPNPMVPTSDGLSLLPYTGSDAGQLTVNGELNKLGHNVTFGHGIHAGIHWRSDSDTALLLGRSRCTKLPER